MARITLYNSTKTELTSGRPVTDVDGWPANLAAADSEENSGRSASVRLIGVEEDVRLVSYEFFMEFSAATDVVKLRWFQEFYTDDASPITSPALLFDSEGNPTESNPYRIRAGYGTGRAVWMRETDLIDGGLGNVDMYPITRRMTMQPVSYLVPPGPTQKFQQSLHVPLAVNAAWVRIAFWIDESSDIDNIELVNFYITAMTGGHTENEYFRQRPAEVYAYDYQTNRELPEGAKVIKKGSVL